MNNFLTKGDQPFIYQLKLIYIHYVCYLDLLATYILHRPIHAIELLFFTWVFSLCFWTIEYLSYRLTIRFLQTDMNWPSNLLSRSATPISMTLDVLIQAVCLYTRHHNAKRSAKTRILFGRKQSISAWTLTVCAMIHTISWQRSIRMALWKLASQFMRYVHYYNHV